MKIPIKIDAEESLRISNGTKLKIDEESQKITITGDNFTLQFNKESGIMNSLKYNSVEYLHTGNNMDGGPTLQLFRAPLDNDGKVQYEWVKHNFDKMKNEVKKFEVIDGIYGKLAAVVMKKMTEKQLAAHNKNQKPVNKED